MTNFNKNNEKSNAYKRAKKRVEEEKGFYTHLTIYIIINITIFFINSNFLDEGFRRWTQFHLYITPFFWGIGLAVHGIRVFNNSAFFGKKWEERKIKEFMDKDPF